MDSVKIKELIQQMTLEEKAGLCSGLDFWRTKPVERLGIPSVAVSDGPHGLRKQSEAADHLGVNDSIKAVCFPAGCALAASFDRKVLTQLGETIGEECQAEDVSTILGPAVNIKRSPLCGRNFEYYSEDPLVSTELAAAFIQGVQSKHVGTSIKHFAANNQEYHRMTSDSVLDERTLREIYLAAFEGAVKKAKPWTVMNSYNKINGTYAGENKFLLTDVLRKDWGFDGYVMTDWGAVNDRVKGLEAGCELEMPHASDYTDQEIAEAVKRGALSESVLDEAVERMLNIVFRYAENRDVQAKFQYEKDHETARKLAEESLVLLKNEEDILPLSKEKKIVFIGKFAQSPRYQGGGSSHINSFKTTSALDAVSEYPHVTYAQGYLDQRGAGEDETLVQEALLKAKEADVAVIFAGLPDYFESEGYDRTHMQMPEHQNRLIAQVAEVQPNTVVVLHNGAPVEMPWIHQVKGVLEAYLGGQAVGEAVVNVLFGQVNPSGKLAETFPLRLEDTPCYLTYGGEHDQSVYTEGVFVGYRYYVSRNMPVLFPFGHGLSYTTFSYSHLALEKKTMKDTDTLMVSVDVTNTGNCAGKEVVQLYVAPPAGPVKRPVRELRAFEKILLQPGETRTVSFELDKRSFSFWDVRIHDWMASTGAYTIEIGKSAQEMLLSETVQLESTTYVPKIFSLNSTMGEIMADPKGKIIMEQAMGAMYANTDAQKMAEESSKSDAINDEMIQATMESMPLRQLLSFVPNLQKESLLQLVAALNG